MSWGTRRCTCDLPNERTVETLMPLGSGCTGNLPHPYICPTLDKARREAERKRRAQERIAKLKAQKGES